MLLHGRRPRPIESLNRITSGFNPAIGTGGPVGPRDFATQGVSIEICCDANLGRELTITFGLRVACADRFDAISRHGAEKGVRQSHDCEDSRDEWVGHRDRHLVGIGHEVLAEGDFDFARFTDLESFGHACVGGHDGLELVGSVHIDGTLAIATSRGDADKEEQSEFWEAFHGGRDILPQLPCFALDSVALTRSRRIWVGVSAICLAACNGGGADALSPQGRFPAAPGVAPVLCHTDLDCPADSACMRSHSDLLVPGGTCLPRRQAGGRCTAASDGTPGCEPGLGCSGKEQTCLPTAVSGASCVAAACGPGLLCGRTDDDWRCVPPGWKGGACRDVSPRCDTGLGCLSGSATCAPLGADKICFDGVRSFGCPDDKVCPHQERDRGSERARCASPGSPGGTCGDPALGRPECAVGLACVERICLSAFTLPFQACVDAPGHARCIDGTQCLGGVCIVLGREGTPCRSRDLFSTQCDPGLECDLGDSLCRTRVPSGMACDVRDPDAPRCFAGASCVRADDANVCVPDGVRGGRCLQGSSSCNAGLVCARARDGGSRCETGFAPDSACSIDREPYEPCIAGYHCSLVSGRCAPDGGLGSVCAAGRVCAVGTLCANNGRADYCYPLPVVVVVDGAPCDDRPTVYQRENRCAEGLSCIDKQCRPKGALGAQCRPFMTDALLKGRCDTNYSCVAERCVPGQPLGSACAPGGDGQCAAPALCVSTGQGQGICTAFAGYTMAMLPKSAPVDACRNGKSVLLLPAREPALAARDEGYGRVPLPFPFSFFGEVHDTIAVSPNGLLGFVTPSDRLAPGVGGAGALPAAFTPALMAVFWDDLAITDDANLCTEVDAAAQTFTVTWRNLVRYGRSSTRLTFSATLHATGEIDYSYDDLWGVGSDGAFASGIRASIGIQAPGGAVSLAHVGIAPMKTHIRFAPRR